MHYIEGSPETRSSYSYSLIYYKPCIILSYRFSNKVNSTSQISLNGIPLKGDQMTPELLYHAHPVIQFS